MHTMALGPLDGIEDLDLRTQTTTVGGFPLAPFAIGVGIYLAKTVGDHWGEFKEGVADGFTAVWGERT